MKKDIFLPDLGEGIDAVDVSEVTVAAGDTISNSDTIIILESDKATMEIPAEYTGKVEKVYVFPGDKISTGTKLITIDAASDKVSTEKEGQTSPGEQKDVRQTKPPPKQTPALTEAVNIKAGPGVRRLARELGINLNIINGTGEKGRITRDDLNGFIKAQIAASTAPAPSPEVDFSKWGEIEKKKLTRLKRITGSRLQAAWRNIPHVTHFETADITDLDAYRNSLKKKHSGSNRKITFLPFLMKAAAKTLEEFPDFNSSLDSSGDVLVYKKYIHIGIAVDTENGLMVPVVRDVNKRSILELCDDVVKMSQKARNKKISPDDLSGGTFTISSLGGIGGTYFTPIVNPPEVAIMGISKSFTQGDSGSMILPFSLSYDHRVIDGAAAARFAARFSEILSDIIYFKKTTT